jgi:hypothetical protein
MKNMHQSNALLCDDRKFLYVLQQQKKRYNGPKVQDGTQKTKNINIKNMIFILDKTDNINMLADLLVVCYKL